MNKEVKRALIFALHSELALPVIRALGWVGIGCYTVTREHFGIHRFSRYSQGGFFAKKVSMQTGDEQFVEKVNTFIRKNEIDVLLGTDTDTTRMLIQCSSQWKGAKLFPSPDLDTFDKLHDKWNFAKFVDQFNLPQPKNQLIMHAEDLNQAELQFPILLKPRIGAGGIGIHRIDDLSSLNSKMKELEAKDQLPIIAQEFIDGHDIDYNFLSENGKVMAWSIQQRVDSKKGLIRFLVNDEVEAICRELIQHSQYTGVGHIDLRIDNKDRRAKFIEINPRFWGSIDYSTAMGMNFPYFGIRLLMKQSIPSTKPPIGDCPYLPISVMGVIRKIIGSGLDSSNVELKKWARFLWLDPVPELIDEFRRRFGKIRPFGTRN